MSCYFFNGLSQSRNFGTQYKFRNTLYIFVHGLQLSPPSKLLESRYLLLVERSKCGAGRSIRALACLVWACVLPLYRNFEPITKKPLGGGSGDTNLWNNNVVSLVARQRQQDQGGSGNSLDRVTLEVDFKIISENVFSTCCFVSAIRIIFDQCFLRHMIYLRFPLCFAAAMFSR